MKSVLASVIVTLLFSTLPASSQVQAPPPIPYPFAESPVPPKPDYANADNWAALPTKADNADLTPAKSIKEDQANATVDVFYIHPTTYFTGDPWNAGLSNTELNEYTDNMPIKHQATIFNGTCRVFAPRYRQAHIRAFHYRNSGGNEALALAYTDVKAAFEYYMAHHNNGRPVIIASHSQGTVHAIRLVKEFFDGKPLADQLVAAYLVGMPFKADVYTHLQPCTDSTATGCYVAWGAYAENYKPAFYDTVCKGTVSINPINWTTDTTFSEMGQAKGLVNRNFKGLHTKCIRARVHDGLLWVTKPKIPFAFLVKMEVYHVADYNLFWMDVRENVALRAKTFQNLGAPLMGK